jgi:Type IV secretion-system coupling protein DNA-binding domain
MDDFKPSVFTPLSRWFTDERARDTEDLRTLYAGVKAQHAQSRFSGPGGFVPLIDDVWDDIGFRVPDSCQSEFTEALRAICALETHIVGFPQPRFDFLNLKEASDLRQFLRRKEYFHLHEARIAGLLRESLALIFGWLASQLPRTEQPSPFTIPLIYALPEPRIVLDNLLGELSKEVYRDAGLYTQLFRTLWINACANSGIDPYTYEKSPKPPSKTDLPLHELVETFCKDTPFYDFFLAPVPLKFTQEDRFSHMHVVGGSGAGKTQLLQNLILHDLKSDNPPALVVVDSQGDLIDKLLHLELFAPGTKLGERLTLITPRDIKHPPALNVFALNQSRFSGYDEETREQVVAGAIQTFDYLFSGLLGADLTAKQNVFFRFVARLMLALPETMGRNATILDILNLLEKPEDYRGAIATLPPIQRNFFERDLLDPKKGTFRETREQIRYRLNAILENPTLARLFTTPETRIDLFDSLNNGGIVLVDTAKAFLKDASAHFGRIFISLVLQAILERAAVPEDERRPTFLIIDEAANYFDSNIDDFLTEARKYKCGCVFAHQYLDQASWTLRSSLAANTSIKFVSHVSTNDARVLAPDLRTTADFILSQPKLHFAAHLRDITPNAVSIPVPYGQLEAEPRMSDEHYGFLRELNRQRVSIPEAPKSPGATMNTAKENDQAGSPIEVRQTPGPKPRSPSNSIDPTEATEDW